MEQEKLDEFLKIEKRPVMNCKWNESDRTHIFALSRLDRYMTGHKGFIAGGCFKDLLMDKHIKDIDVFFKNKEDYEASVEMLRNDENYAEAYKSEKVQAFRHNDGTVIECVKSVFGTPVEVISKFDFTITKFAYWKDEGDGVVEYKALFHPQFFEHLMLKKLVIDDAILFPMSTFNRTYKYAKYGFKPCTETKVKLAKAISKLQEDEITVPENMYDGVD